MRLQFILLLVPRFLFVTCLLVTYSLQAQTTQEFLITNYGAVGDGHTLNTTAIQQAIDAATAEGGGKVTVPEGEFLTGSIVLKSNVALYLQQGASLLGSTVPGDYISLEMNDRPESPKQDDNSQLALLLAYKADNISISGPGTIDGQGRALALHIDSLHHAGIVVDPNYSVGAGRPNEKMRPKLVRLSTCNNVDFTGTTFRNSASWGLSFELCNGLVLDSLTIFNRAYWNNDGMDITDSKNVRVTNCDVNSADDGICLKSYYPGYANDSIYISNCTIRSGASAIKFGTASYGGFKNITIDNNRVFDTFRSAIALESVDGGTIENVTVTSLIATNTGNAIFIRLAHRGGDSPGSINNVLLRDISVQIPYGRADLDYDIRAPEPGFHNPFPSSITGIPGHEVENIVMENIQITYPGRASKGQAYLPISRLDAVPELIQDYPEFSMFGELPAWGLYVRHAQGMKLKNVTLNVKEPDFRPALVFDDVRTVDIEDLHLFESSAAGQIILKDVDGFSAKPSLEDFVDVID